MRLLPLAFLFLASVSRSLGSAKQQGKCPPKPKPLYNIKFTDKGGDEFYHYELHGSARIVEPAPKPVTRALRIDEVYSYALLKDLDISPSKMKDVTLAIGLYIESIRPMHQDGKKLFAKETVSHGWVAGHDNGRFDRAIFLHDQRFNGMGISPGYRFPGNVKWTPPKTNKWVQIIAIWRQGGECELYHDNTKIQFSRKVIGRNDNGLPNLSIGSLEQRNFGAVNDNDVWIRGVQVFDWALEKEELEALDCDFNNDLEPNIDCGNGGPLVESCTDCPIGEGASGCKGDCVWDRKLPICKEDDEPTVNCGDHNALDCGQCDATVEDTSGCAGECKWDVASNSCQNDDYEPPAPPVDCGTHKESTCEKCPVGEGAEGCSGDCMWDPAIDTCIDDNGQDVSCGDHDAADCSHCDATAEDTSRCRGDCKWDTASNVCVDLDYDPFIDCGGDRKAATCGECPDGEGASGCAGECMWDDKLGVCIDDDDEDVDCGDHDAASCGDCDAGKSDTSGCSGECKWSKSLGSCIKPPGDGECAGCAGECTWDPPSSKKLKNTAVDCGGDKQALTCEKCTNHGNPAGCYGQCEWNKAQNKCVNRPDGGVVVQCGNHHAPSCSACGDFPKNTRLQGMYYSSDFGGSEPHEILQVHGPVSFEEKFELKKQVGGQGVLKGMVSIRIYMKALSYRKAWTKNHQITNANIRTTYCPSSHTKYPAEIQAAEPGYKNPYWMKGYVVIFNKDKWVFIYSDNKKPQLYFSTATESQKEKYIT